MRPAAFASLRSFFAISDEQAMWRVRMQDSEQAFALLVRRWEPPIQRLCARMTGDPHRAEDLAQEAFLRVFVQRKAYQPDAKFSTWLWRIALNLCYDELRRRRRRSESGIESVATDSAESLETFRSRDPGPDRVLADRERGEQVRWALDQLPDIYRAVVVLRHYEDMKFREIAQVLDVPEGTVKSRMAEALAQLHRLLTPAKDEAPARTGPEFPVRAQRPQKANLSL